MVGERVFVVGRQADDFVDKQDEEIFKHFKMWQNCIKTDKIVKNVRKKNELAAPKITTQLRQWKS